jgi:hypothetical protein
MTVVRRRLRDPARRRDAPQAALERADEDRAFHMAMGIALVGVNDPSGPRTLERAARFCIGAPAARDGLDLRVTAEGDVQAGHVAALLGR